MPPCRAEIQAGMVDVHALLHHPVHPDQQLRVVGIPRPHPVGCDREEDILKILRHIDREAEPCMRIVAVAPCVLFRVKRGQRGIARQFPRLFVAAGRPSDVRDSSERHRTVDVQNFQIFFQFPYILLHFVSPMIRSFFSCGCRNVTPIGTDASRIPRTAAFRRFRLCHGDLPIPQTAGTPQSRAGHRAVR